MIVRATMLVLLLAFGAAASCQAQSQQAGERAHKMLQYIANNAASDGIHKPVARTAVHPEDRSGPLMFAKQSDLTADFVDHYLSRAISHFLPWKTPGRSREFLRYTGAKYIHWSHLLWGQPPSQSEFELATREIDTVHSSDWGQDVVFEAGVMEIIRRDAVDSTPIPDWLYKCIEDLGIARERKPGPNGPGFFSYNNMFDRDAPDWPKSFIGMWQTKPDDDAYAGVPDITMLETQLWYAYLISEYIDAGFEGIMFGQIGLVGRRDKGWECARALTEFARTYASKRAYRNAVFLTTHHWQVDYKGKPVFTHLTWPLHMFYSDRFRHGMECGLHASEATAHPARRNTVRLLEAPHDLPVLREIDNSGQMEPGHPLAASPDGDDEITGFMKKSPFQRAAFLRQYYFEFQTYKNVFGKNRMHLAPSGERCGYMPYKELGGEEETIKLLFETAE